MNIIRILTFFAILFSQQTSAYKNKGVFRIENTIILWSDFARVVDEIKTFHCIYPEGMVFKFSHLDKVKWPKLGPPNKTWTKELLSFREKILSFLLLSNYSSEQKVVVHDSVQSAMAENFKNNKCGSPKQKMSARMLNFIRTEIYLNSRIGKNAIWVSKLDIRSAKESFQGKQKSDEQIKKEILERKKLEATRTLREAILNQVSFEVF